MDRSIDASNEALLLKVLHKRVFTVEQSSSVQSNILYTRKIMFVYCGGTQKPIILFIDLKCQVFF